VSTKTKAETNKNGSHKSKRISQGPREINSELLSSVLAKIRGEMLLGFWLCTCGSCEPQFWQKTFSLGLMK
jgi:hypothetical protein